jgi:hypothetical protein
MKTTASTEEVSSHPGEKGRWEHKKASEHPLCQRKTEGGLKNGLATLWRGKRIAKKAHAGRGQETQWEISIGMTCPFGGWRNDSPPPRAICALRISVRTESNTPLKNKALDDIINGFQLIDDYAVTRNAEYAF